MQDNSILKNWLSHRKISDSIISEFNVHWGSNPTFGECIVIPVVDPAGDFSFNKYRRNPLSDDKPKYLYDKGSKSTLYGAYKIKDASKVLITEGEMDCLVAWSANIPAVSGTGGAMTFLPEWAELLKGKEVIICFDNDEAGGAGMVRVLELIPTAKILFLPDRPGVKDISDYVQNGGDLHSLIKGAKYFASLEEVIENRSYRASRWSSVHFHDAYIKANTKPTYAPRARKEGETDKILRARDYPISELMEFTKHKARCLWHNEKTASLHYYEDKNRVYCFGGCGKGFDAIDVYRQLYNCSFKEAVDKLQ